MNRSCVMMTSLSIPITSVTWVMRREPSRRRAAWMITSIEAQIISRMVREGSEKPPMVIMDSRRASASRGLLACSVPIEPSWPVFIACSRSKASAPRTSPTMIRSGRMRRQLRTRSRMVTWPSPSRFGGRVSSRTTFAGDDPLAVLDEAGQHVEQGGLAGAGPAGDHRVDARAADHFEDLGAFPSDRAIPDQLIEREFVAPELADRQGGPVERQRRHDDVDARAVGQARVADRRGIVNAPADLADDALADVEQLVIVAEANASPLNLSGDLDVDGLGAVHHDVGDVIAREQRLERAVAEHTVADIVEQLL